MTTIRIADEPHPARQNTSEFDVENAAAVPNATSIYEMGRLGRTRTNATEDGIVNIRERIVTRDRRSLSLSSGPADEDPGLRRPGDYRHAQVFSGWTLITLSFQSLGVIYGDIGTSPLYVFSGTFTEPPTKQDLVGVLSLVLWSLILMVTIKYVLVILNADNDGEGGTFSTYSLLARHLNITNRDPRESSLVEMKRVASGDLESAGRYLRSGIEKSRFIKGALKVIGIFAVTMVLSDGILTPAQSVLGAVQGIEVAAPNISKGTIVGVTDAILIILFAIQPFGVEKISLAFAPIIVIWLLMNAVFGIYNLVLCDASVFKAFYPWYAFDFLIRHREEGWKHLGGVLLCFTGVEALFADLGAFSKKAIRLSWLGLVLPCLFMTYIGQAAYISVHPEAYSNPVFNAAPPGTLYPTLIIAILAAIVASQAIITASFQLLAQVMKLSYFPQLKVVHTSKKHHGQLYVPVANWLLMLGTILVASIYNNTTSLGNAYGVCVIFVCFFDTLMVSLAGIFVWRISPYLVFLPWLFFASLDGAFLSSALLKVPDGAWFTLLLAVLLASIFLLWRFGKEQQWFSEAEDRFPTSHFITKTRDGALRLTDMYHGIALSNIRGLGIFFDKAGETTPIVFSQFITKLTALPEVMVFFHLRPLERPSVAAEDRYTVSRLGVPSCYRLVVRYGYNDEVVTPDLASVIFDQIHGYLSRQVIDNDATAQSTSRRVSIDPQARRRSIAAPPDDDSDDAANKDTTANSSSTAFRSKHVPGQDAIEVKTGEMSQSSQEIVRLEEAYRHKVLYIVGKEQMKTRIGTNWFRSTLLWAFLWIRDNTRNRIANLKLPADNLVEVGFLKEI